MQIDFCILQGHLTFDPNLEFYAAFTFQINGKIYFATTIILLVHHSVHSSVHLEWCLLKNPLTNVLEAIRRSSAINLWKWAAI